MDEVRENHDSPSESLKQLQEELEQAEKRLSEAKRALEAAKISIPTEESNKDIKGKFYSIVAISGLFILIVLFILSMQVEDALLSNAFRIVALLVFFLLMLFNGTRDSTLKKIEEYKRCEKRVNELRAKTGSIYTTSVK
jgi:hypothetical protein